MTPMSTSPSLLIAAHDPAHSSALTELLLGFRPQARILYHRDQPSADEPSLALVIESLEPDLGQLSRQVRQRHPRVAIVVIAPRFDDRALDVAASVEAAAIITSPCEPAALLRALKAQERRVRFRGRAGSIETAELLRLYARSGSTGVLHLAREGQSGAIHLEDGQPVHAHLGELCGAEAVRQLLSWPDTKATWIAGRSASVRTIVGRVEGLLERDPTDTSAPVEVEDAPRDVLEKLERLAQTEDILAAHLLRNAEIVTGSCDSSLDEAVVGRALSRLAQVYHDMEVQQGDGAGTEIQATVGEHRLVVDRLGPSRLGFQIGVVVRQATPVCKSLRRLLRQIDRSFRKSLAQAARSEGASPDTGPHEAASLHRVA